MTTNRRIALGAAAGLLAAAAGVGASLLVAALIEGAPNPVTAVGNRFIDLTPGPLKDWAIRTLGTYDKPALLAGIGLVIALLAATAGVLAWRHRGWALVLTALLGSVAVLSAAADGTRSAGVLERIAPATAALIVSVGMLAWFTRGWSTRTPRSVDDRAAASTGFDRRGFLTAAAVSVVVAAAGYVGSGLTTGAGARSRAAVKLPRPADAAPPVDPAVSLDVPGITPHLTDNEVFYRVDTALSVPQIDAEQWRLRIHGLVDEELELTYADLLAMPLVERRITLTCVSNEVGGEYVGNASWLGVRIKDLLERVGVRPDADAVKSTSVDGFTIGTPVAALVDGRDAMIAIGMNGEPLPLERGFPARMVVPGLYGYVSATKWLVDLEVTRFDDFTAYWTERDWAPEAPIKTASRIDVPASLARVPAGTVAVAGVAWAQNVGIRGVEVRVDEGAWQPARLAREDSIDTWRQWSYAWDATPGTHRIEVRATDGDGTTQTSQREPPRPDGASGWHSVVVTVE